MIFFYIRQKTAYELLMSDWSSDVCSSDLLPGLHGYMALAFDTTATTMSGAPAVDPVPRIQPIQRPSSRSRIARPRTVPSSSISSRRSAGASWRRSEEHTSELQSLMRISYAVFCLKKKKQNSKYK